MNKLTETYCDVEDKVNAQMLLLGRIDCVYFPKNRDYIE